MLRKRPVDTDQTVSSSAFGRNYPAEQWERYDRYGQPTGSLEVLMSSDGNPDTIPMMYREFAVPARLASHFLCLWSQTTGRSTGEYAHRVLPDGCIDIVLVNDDPPEVVGPWTEFFVFQLRPGMSILGARLHPGRAPSVLGLPALEVLNQSVPLRAVSGGLGKARFDRVRAMQTKPI